MLRDSVSQGRTVVPVLHANGQDYWIICHDFRTNTFAAYPFTAQGVGGTPVVSAVGPTPGPISTNSGTSYYKTSPNSEWLAVMDLDTGLQLYRINRATGQLTYHLGHDDNYSNNSYIFHATGFSPDNSKLYLARNAQDPQTGAAPTDLFQYDLTAGSPAAIIASRQLVMHRPDVVRIFDMQLAIDGKLYLTANRPGPPNYGEGDPYLSVINCPNASGTACDFQFQTIDLLGCTAGRDLPTQNQALFRNANTLQVTAAATTLCRGDTTRLVAYGAGATRFLWTPAAGLSSDTAATPLAFPAATTTYSVTAARACGPPLTASVTIRVGQPTTTLTAGAGRTLCAGATTTLGGTFDPAAAYQWAPATFLSDARAPQPTLRLPASLPDTVLTYRLTAACSPGLADTVRITVLAAPRALVGPRQRTACPGDTLRLGTGPALPGLSYQWTPATGLDDPASPAPLLTLPARAPPRTPCGATASPCPAPPPAAPPPIPSPLPFPPPCPPRAC